MLRKLRQHVERADRQPELARVRQLADARPEVYELVAPDLLFCCVCVFSVRRRVFCTWRVMDSCSRLLCDNPLPQSVRPRRCSSLSSSRNRHKSRPPPLFDCPPPHVGRALHDGLRHVEDLVAVQAQAVEAVGALDERADVLADELVELFKDGARLLRGGAEKERFGEGLGLGSRRVIRLAFGSRLLGAFVPRH